MGVVVLGAAAFSRMMKKLLPPGAIWQLDDDSIVSKVLLAAGDELARISQRAEDLWNESDPTQTSELLEDFESQLGLDGTGTDAERQAKIVARLVARQRVRPVDYQRALAKLLGQSSDDVVVIENDRAFAVSVSDDSEIFKFYIYRDPSLPGSYDLDSAQELVDEIQHSHTDGYVIESIDFKCDEATSLCDRDILGV